MSKQVGVFQAENDPLAGELVSRWTSLIEHPNGSRAELALGGRLLAHYAEPSRRYHDQRHLLAVLDGVELLRGEAAQPRLVLLAAWFHDAVYDVHRDDNEDESARLAEATLPPLGLTADEVAEVARLVRVTQTHAADPSDSNAIVLCDADLAVLAGSPPAYAAYARAIRDEYRHVSDDDFRAGRSAVLRQLLALPTLFGSRYGCETWESPARANLAAELATLTA